MSASEKNKLAYSASGEIVSCAGFAHDTMSERAEEK